MRWRADAGACAALGNGPWISKIVPLNVLHSCRKASRSRPRTEGTQKGSRAGRPHRIGIITSVIERRMKTDPKVTSEARRVHDTYTAAAFWWSSAELGLEHPSHGRHCPSRVDCTIHTLIDGS